MISIEPKILSAMDRDLRKLLALGAAGGAQPSADAAAAGAGKK